MKSTIIDIEQPAADTLTTKVVEIEDPINRRLEEETRSTSTSSSEGGAWEGKQNPDRVEQHPYQGFSYILGVVQFMLITLDLFMDTSVQPAWHFTITAIENVSSMYLCLYQFVRLYFWLLRRVQKRSPICAVVRDKAFGLLVSSMGIQTAIAVISGFSYAYNLDSLEFAMFALAILWGILHPMTFDAVAQSNSQGEKNEKTVMSPASAVWSIFRHHFTKAPLLAFFGTVFATAHALLNTMQGALINELNKGVTRPMTSAEDVAYLASSLVGVWAATNLAKFIFDCLSAAMFSCLELWLRKEIFQKAMQEQKTLTIGSESISLASYQARYASDVAGVVSLYSTLLKGVVVNLLLVITNFCYLAYEDKRVACVTLGFLAMGVTGGPTNLAGQNAAATQQRITAGISLLGQAQNEENDTSQFIIQQHKEQVLEPLKGILFRKNFYADFVDTFIQFFSTFLTMIVIITMSWSHYHGKLDGSQFVGIFFIFKQLQKPAGKLSGVVKKLAGKTANLERINEVVLGTE